MANTFVPIGVERTEMTLGDIKPNEDFIASTIQFLTPDATTYDTYAAYTDGAKLSDAVYIQGLRFEKPISGWLHTLLEFNRLAERVGKCPLKQICNC